MTLSIVRLGGEAEIRLDLRVRVVIVTMTKHEAASNYLFRYQCLEVKRT